jgi:hypothetical protein
LSYSPRHAIVRAVRSLSAGAKLAVATVATGGLLATGAVLAINAGASTNGCVSGPLKGTCGTQADAQASPLYLASDAKAAVPGTAIVGIRPNNVRRVLDFDWFNPAGVPNNGKLAEYAPFGHRSGLCMAGHNVSGKVNLRPCNASYGTQVWQFSNGEWIDQNGAGSVLTLHFNGQAASVVTGPVATPSPRQQFTFVTATS